MSGANGLGRYINGRPNQNIFNVNRPGTSIRTLPQLAAVPLTDGLCQNRR